VDHLFTITAQFVPPGRLKDGDEFFPDSTANPVKELAVP